MPIKYQLETIPVWNALSRDTECLLCDLEDESERRNVDFFLGSSVMAPEMRVELNKHGFCPRHFHMLAAGTGKLGYALALVTHTGDLATRLDTLGRRLVAAGNKKPSATRAVADLTDAIAAQEIDCLMCDRIHLNLGNYAFTIAKLFQSDPEFRGAFAASRGVCLHHLPLVLRLGLAVLKPGELTEWHRVIVDSVQRSVPSLIAYATRL